MSSSTSGIPIYYVVSEVDLSNTLTRQYGVEKIVKVFACDFEDIDYLYRQEVGPLQSMGRIIYTRMYVREVPNPFKELAKDVDRQHVS